MSVGIPIHDGTYKTWPERSAYFEQIFAKVADVPGVKLSAVSSNATPPNNGFKVKFEIVGKPSSAEQSVRFNMVSKEYFPVLKIPLMQGRIWDEAETRRGAAVAVVNQAFVKRYFPAADAVGHTVKVQDFKAQPPYFLTAPGSEDGLLIVGVVGDKLDEGLSKPVVPRDVYSLYRGHGNVHAGPGPC